MNPESTHLMSKETPPPGSGDTDESAKKRNPLGLREIRKRRRERLAIIGLSILFVTLTILEFRITRVSSSLPFVNSIFFFGLLNLNIICLVALTWLIVRNVGKLFLERRSRVLGARLKTKLVIAFLSFSIIPTVTLFLISSLYINSSFDKWFSLKIQNTLQASLEITGTYYRNADRTAMHFAEHMARLLSIKMNEEGYRPRSSIPTDIPRTASIRKFLEEQRRLLALTAVEYYPDPIDVRVLTTQEQTLELPHHYPRIPLDLLERAFAGKKVSVIQHIGSGDLIRCLAPVFANRSTASRSQPVIGILAVTSYIPVSLTSKVAEIASVFDDYKDTNPLKYPIKTTYFVLLIMITAVIIFVAIWIGVYLARELTVPVERLVRGAQAVGAGNLDVTIERTGHDEIGVLVESFNKMTQDLKENRERLDSASHALENRRAELEAVLASIGAGVIVMDSEGSVTTFNRAAAQILETQENEVLGKTFKSALPKEAQPLIDVIERAFEDKPESEPAEVTQWNFHCSDGETDTAKALAAIATSLKEDDESWGVVAVIDDMTQLVKGQREMAWREVARRIAHEIKNPLTPIKLSAQRLQRRLGGIAGDDGHLIKECTETIVKHTDELKEMVNEFSNFARLPEAQPAPHDLKEVLREVTSLLTQAHPDIRFIQEIDTKLPIFDFDRDQIKRVVINLMDNAVAAIQVEPNSPQTVKGVIQSEVSFNEKLQMVVLSISDNGPGMSEETRNRVFEPYFSTKKEGTGLGLAIAKRIVNDHNGFIRVQSSPGQGTKFVIELPTTIKPSFIRGDSNHVKVDSHH